MNKFKLFLFFTILIVSSIYSQFGIELKTNYTYVNSSKENLYESIGGFGYSGGVFFNVPIKKNKIYLLLGTNYSFHNFVIKNKKDIFIREQRLSINKHTDLKNEIGLIKAPIEIQYVLGQNNPISLYISGTPSYILFSKTIFENKGEIELNGNSEFLDIFNEFNIFIGGGVNCNITKIFELDETVIINLKLGYEKSVENIYNKKSISYRTSNSNFVVDKSEMILNNLNIGVTLEF